MELPPPAGRKYKSEPQIPAEITATIHSEPQGCDSSSKTFSCFADSRVDEWDENRISSRNVLTTKGFGSGRQSVLFGG